MYKPVLVLNKLQGLIYHKTQPTNYSSPFVQWGGTAPGSESLEPSSCFLLQLPDNNLKDQSIDICVSVHFHE